MNMNNRIDNAIEKNNKRYDDTRNERKSDLVVKQHQRRSLPTCGTRSTQDTEEINSCLLHRERSECTFYLTFQFEYMPQGTTEE